MLPEIQFPLYRLRATGRGRDVKFCMFFVVHHVDAGDVSQPQFVVLLVQVLPVNEQRVG